MTKIVNMHQAKSTLSALVEQALSGEEIILARAGEQVVRLVPIEQKPRQRKLGQWKGKVRISEDFDAPLPANELAHWLGSR